MIFCQQFSYHIVCNSPLEEGFLKLKTMKLNMNQTDNFLPTAFAITLALVGIAMPVAKKIAASYGASREKSVYII